MADKYYSRIPFTGIGAIVLVIAIIDVNNELIFALEQKRPNCVAMVSFIRLLSNTNVSHLVPFAS